MKVSRSTARKLRDIAAAITEKPTKFEMDSWVEKKEDCGTTCCIGGFACVQAGISPRALLGPDDGEEWVSPRRVPVWLAKHATLRTGYHSDRDGYAVDELGRLALGLSVAESSKLFYVSEWGIFEEPFYSAASPKAKALVAAARIEHFIETGE